MPVEVEFSDEARGHVRVVDEWWRANRLSAPGLFRDELAAAVEHLRFHPLAGRRYDATSEPEIRRLVLPRTRYHVYYAIHETRVLIHAVWHTSRGQGPTLG